MMTLIYTCINKDASDATDLKIYFEPEESCCPYPVIIEDPVARGKFVQHFLFMLSKAKSYDILIK